MTETIERPLSRNGNTERLPVIAPPRLPYHPEIEKRFSVDKASWKALVEAIFPNASSTESVILALSYCRARKLDPFKRNVHIVPIWSKDLGRMTDTIWPGIGELRTTAFRTGEYAGRDAATFGPNISGNVGSVNMTYPEWCQVTVYRLVRGQRVAFAGPQVYWIETYATASRKDNSPNEMWATRTRGQIEKCAEAAALRAAFPEEVGSDYIAEEVQHQSGDGKTSVVGSPKSATRALSDRLGMTSQLSEGQTLSDIDTGEVLQEGDAAPAEQPQPESGPSESDVAVVDAQPPEDPTPAPMTPREQFVIQVHEAANAEGITDAVRINTAIQTWAIACKPPVKGKEDKATQAEKDALYTAMKERRGVWAFAQ